MAEFDFHFKHKSGCSNQVAEALSHKSKLAALRLLVNMSASVVNTPIKKCIRDNLEKDLAVLTILKLVEESKNHYFLVEDGLLWAKSVCIYVPRARDLQRVLLR